MMVFLFRFEEFGRYALSRPRHCIHRYITIHLYEDCFLPKRFDGCFLVSAKMQVLFHRYVICFCRDDIPRSWGCRVVFAIKLSETRSWREREDSLCRIFSVEMLYLLEQVLKKRK